MKKKSCSNCLFKDNNPKQDDDTSWDPCDTCGSTIIHGEWVPENWVDKNRAQGEEQ